MTEKKLWQKYKGTSAEELCAAIRELWLAKSPDYIRLLNEVPNKLIEREAGGFGSPKASGDWEDVGTGRKLSLAEAEAFVKSGNRHFGRQVLKDLERFLDKPPFGDHFHDNAADALEDEIYWADPDAPLDEYVEADKKRDALIKKYSLKTS